VTVDPLEVVRDPLDEPAPPPSLLPEPLIGVVHVPRRPHRRDPRVRLDPSEPDGAQDVEDLVPERRPEDRVLVRDDVVEEDEVVPAPGLTREYPRRLERRVRARRGAVDEEAVLRPVPLAPGLDVREDPPVLRRLQVAPDRRDAEDGLVVVGADDPDADVGVPADLPEGEADRAERRLPVPPRGEDARVETVLPAPGDERGPGLVNRRQLDRRPVLVLDDERPEGVEAPGARQADEALDVPDVPLLQDLPVGCLSRQGGLRRLRASSRSGRAACTLPRGRAPTSRRSSLVSDPRC